MVPGSRRVCIMGRWFDLFWFDDAVVSVKSKKGCPISSASQQKSPKSHMPNGIALWSLNIFGRQVRRGDCFFCSTPFGRVQKIYGTRVHVLEYFLEEHAMTFSKVEQSVSYANVGKNVSRSKRWQQCFVLRVCDVWCVSFYWMAGTLLSKYASSLSVIVFVGTNELFLFF